MLKSCFVLVAAAVLLTPALSRATVTNVAYYHLGEVDAGEGVGLPIATAVDSVAGNTLTATGAPVFSADVAAAAAAHAGSLASVEFSGSNQYLNGAIFDTATDDFGIEAWVKPLSAVGNHAIAYNGNTSNNGWGLYQIGGGVAALFGANVLWGSNALPTGVWTHVALVKDTGVSSLYVNGVVVATSVAIPYPPAAAGFSIGATGQGGTNENFDGLIDEVRVFSFASGQFSPTNLLLNSSPPAFLQVPAPNLVFSHAGQIGWADFFGSGRKDMLISYRDSSDQPHFEIWRNLGNNVFSNAGANLPQLINVSFAVGDFDNDGLPDVLVTGYDSSDNYYAQIWRNQGGGVFSLDYNFPAIGAGGVAVGDFNRDGKLDVVLTGLTNLSPASAVFQVWQNLGNGSFTRMADLPGVSGGAVAVADFDGDGWPDIVVSGEDTNTVPVTQVWRNLGHGSFTKMADLSGVSLSSVAVGDYDNDGYPDIFLSGNAGSGDIDQLWHNQGGTGFAQVSSGITPDIGFSAAWGDYDNDGNLDLLTAGIDGGGNLLTLIWRNVGNNQFTNINAGVTGLFLGSVAWADFDNDGRLGFMVAGWDTGKTGHLQLWRNLAPVTNTPPVAPAPNRVQLSGSHALLSWKPAKDLQTPSSGLTYNVRVGSAPGASDVLSPLSASDGTRRVVQMGNTTEAAALPLAITPGQTYYWSVQSVDTAFAGSAFSPEQSFTAGLVLTPPGGIPVAGDTNGDGIVDQNELNSVLRNFWATSPPQIGPATYLGNGQLQFSVTNGGGATFTILATTNLSLPMSNWVVLGPSSPAYQITNSDTNISQQFFRLQFP